MRPSLVGFFELPELESKERLKQRRVDPATGEYYNLRIDEHNPKDEATASRLIEMNEDKETPVDARLKHWNSMVSALEEAFKHNMLPI